MRKPKIVNTVPVPELDKGHKGNFGINPKRRRYEFHKMHIGESFKVSMDMAGNVRRAKWIYEKTASERFITRTVVERGVKVLRCWRIL